MNSSADAAIDCGRSYKIGDPPTQTTNNVTQSGISDPVVKASLDKIMTGLQTAQDAGPTYTGPGATTLAGQAGSLSAAGDPSLGTGVSNAFGQINPLIANGGLTASQSGNLSDTNNLASLYSKMALDPGSTPEGQNLINSVTRDTNAAFNNSGLFGSDNNQSALSKGLTEGLGNLQQGYLSGQSGALSNAFGMGQQGTTNTSSLAQLLPSLYQTGQLPSQTQQSVGAAQDTAAQNKANANLTLLQQLSSIGGLSAANAPTQSSSSTTGPSNAPNPLLALLGLAIGAA